MATITIEVDQDDQVGFVFTELIQKGIGKSLRERGGGSITFTDRHRFESQGEKKPTTHFSPREPQQQQG